ncbi:prolyl oligopeptidase family serine peptidase [Herbiconiux sp. KACC 21604]|uniref:alpha/beta hydrolase family protein n=1 Tax=unclassified Herbiconiux TaxID=2618217 RepID=UPI0014930CBD|nr:prolyl oligopeptidase family serine peptidase [Herbiconiux sp. SALV-R1]QJU53400.1 prolyl oligopeptidase family serine peptidase [Herbiconiux sp. SALV-R1]WPO88365.1 prolyl oligopeptidase family serine peptidase [Herbiconiux sp. KACC 21604]
MNDRDRFSPNDDWDFEIRTVLGGAVEGASEPGEVLAATAGIRKGDHEAWYVAWASLGDRVSEIADQAAAGGHRVSAAEAYLRASHYYAVAVNAVSSLPDSDRLAPTFGRQRRAWESFVDNTPVQVERVGIPYENASLPGFLFRPGAAGGATVVAVNGSDGSLASLWASCVSPALRRGYTVLVFDGPGQQTQLFDRGVPFRPDWENVLTPVYDFVAAQPGVDPARIGLYGISQGGYWVARALAFEHRFAAAVTDPGVVDVSTSWTSHLPSSLLKLLDRGENEKFDKEMALGLKLSPDTARTWQFRARPYGTAPGAYAETIEAVRRYALGDLAARITTPLLITDPEGEQFWPGQSERLAALTESVSTLVHFTAAEGASGHCQPLARTLTAQRMFDWMDERMRVGQN